MYPAPLLMMCFALSPTDVAVALDERIGFNETTAALSQKDRTEVVSNHVVLSSGADGEWTVMYHAPSEDVTCVIAAEPGSKIEKLREAEQASKA